MRETPYQNRIIDLAHWHGLWVAHFRPARTLEGWRTAVAADGAGWPDLAIVGDGGFILREVKGTGGTVSPQQAEWHARLDAAGVDVGTWGAGDWGRVQAELRRLTGRPR